MANTERVTLRVPESDLEQVEMLVELGEFANRSEAIRQAIKDLIRSRADQVQEDVEAREKIQDAYTRNQQLQNLKQQLEEQRAVLDELMQQ